jgi:hypothetical protein
LANSLSYTTPLFPACSSAMGQGRSVAPCTTDAPNLSLSLSVSHCPLCLPHRPSLCLPLSTVTPSPSLTVSPTVHCVSLTVPLSTQVVTATAVLTLLRKAPSQRARAAVLAAAQALPAPAVRFNTLFSSSGNNARFAASMSRVALIGPS